MGKNGQNQRKSPTFGNEMVTVFQTKYDFLCQDAYLGTWVHGEQILDFHWAVLKGACGACGAIAAFVVNTHSLLWEGCSTRAPLSASWTRASRLLYVYSPVCGMLYLVDYFCNNQASSQRNGFNFLHFTCGFNNFCLLLSFMHGQKGSMFFSSSIHNSSAFLKRKSGAV